jgi:DNA-binding Xre family transcriptional regulator
MAFTYKPLWKLLIDKDMTKKELMQKAGISKSTVDKMGRGEIVSLDIIDRICNYFDCSIEDVVEHTNQEKEEKGKHE